MSVDPFHTRSRRGARLGSHACEAARRALWICGHLIFSSCCAAEYLHDLRTEEAARSLAPWNRTATWGAFEARIDIPPIIAAPACAHAVFRDWRGPRGLPRRALLTRGRPRASCSMLLGLCASTVRFSPEATPHSLRRTCGRCIPVKSRSSRARIRCSRLALAVAAAFIEISVRDRRAQGMAAARGRGRRAAAG